MINNTVISKLFSVILIICFSVSTSSAQASLLRSFFNGAASALGEIFVKSIFDDDSADEYIKTKLAQLDSRITEIDAKIEVINSQISTINQNINSLDARLSDVEEALPFGSFGIGYASNTFGQIDYQQLKSQAVVRMMQAQIGLNLTVSDINLPEDLDLKRNKNDLNNIVNHFNVGSEEGPAYLRLGRVESSSFGHSFVMRNYSNNNIYNIQQFGFKAGVNHFLVGGELFSSNLSEDRIRAGRIKARPLVLLQEKTSSSVLLTEFAFNYISDTEINGDNISFKAFDFKIPYITGDSDQFSVVYLFGNYATMTDNGTGYGIGLAVDYNTEITGIGFWTEYRKLTSNFITGYFNPFYETGRLNPSSSSSIALDNRNENAQEIVVGFEYSLSGLNFNGYYIKDYSSLKNNYLHVESNLNFPLKFIDEENPIMINLNSSIDHRNIEQANDFNIKDSWRSDNNDIIFSLLVSAHYPIGQEIDIFAKYLNQDFFFLDNLMIVKKNTSSLLFGLQYNWGVRD